MGRGLSGRKAEYGKAPKIDETIFQELCVTIFCLKFVRHTMYLWLPLYLKKTLGTEYFTYGSD